MEDNTFQQFGPDMQVKRESISGRRFSIGICALRKPEEEGNQQNFTFVPEDTSGGDLQQSGPNVQVKRSSMSDRKYSLGVCALSTPEERNLPKPFSENTIKFNVKRALKKGTYFQKYVSEAFHSSRFQYKLQCELTLTVDSVNIGIRLLSGKKDKSLHWPFSRTIRIIVLHKSDPSKNVSREVDKKSAPNHQWLRPEGEASEFHYEAGAYIPTTHLDYFVHKGQITVVVKLS